MESGIRSPCLIDLRSDVDVDVDVDVDGVLALYQIPTDHIYSGHQNQHQQTDTDADTDIDIDIDAGADASRLRLEKYEIPGKTRRRRRSGHKQSTTWNLVTLDLSLFDEPGGKEKLAAQLKDAAHGVGFFGPTQDQISRQYAIGQAFYALPFSEQLKHRAPLEEGNYNGYRSLGKLPDEDALVRGHRYEANCDSALRYMMSGARSKEENDRCNNLYTRGHTAFGSLTFVFQQPVAALQVKRSWEWLRIPEGHVAVNIGDIVEFLSNGYLKSGVHRVISPPEDQASVDRLGLLYFVRPSDEMDLEVCG
ncbi:Clavaminate synthase-like protein [Aspergillus heteromorphus CBS 117.55]|uniref:Clavaminate synthase-like protein n=1 Tax=Aspergillus heteromorphus CBS 117.55 TaxID=1448321 RepID=A0A317VJN1_9EURO|nr:Clavaminate synthase-like protein [Aspergillus heteromorphus CBS 117.55]PWY73649.1 Clavaminate synthase-like protein [Aspergillus heteromorphus CBS 117.55]